MKICSKCSKAKPLTEFSKGTKSRGGLRSGCKAYVKIANTAHYAANREKIKAASIKYRAEHPEKCRVRDAQYRSDNINKLRARRAQYRAENLDKERARVATYRADNQEEVKAYNAQWRADNPDYRAKYRADNPEGFRIYSHNRRARERDVGGKLSAGLVARLFTLQRGKCACCKTPLGDNYHRDHYIPLALDGPNEDRNMQLLCVPCNLQKGAKHPIDFMQQRGFLL